MNPRTRKTTLMVLSGFEDSPKPDCLDLEVRIEVKISTNYSSLFIKVILCSSHEPLELHVLNMVFSGRKQLL